MCSHPAPQRSACRLAPLLFLAVLMATIQASDITVLNLNDSGAGSLRAAIAGASSGDRILFAPALVAGGPATVSLTTAGDFTYGPSAFLVSTTLTIEGPSGSNGIALSRNSATANLRLFAVGAAGNLTLKNLTVKDGTAIGGNGGNGGPGGGGAAGLGGAIYNAGTLKVIQSTLTNNTARGGNGGSSVGNRGGGGGGGGLGGGGGNGAADPSFTTGPGGGGGGTSGPGASVTIGANPGGAGGPGGTGGAAGTAGVGTPTVGGAATAAGGGGGGTGGIGGRGGDSGFGGGAGAGGGGGTSGDAGDAGFGGGGGGSGGGILVGGATGGNGGFAGGGGGGNPTAFGLGGFGAGNGGTTGSSGGGGGGGGLGGAIFNDQGATLNISNSTLSGNFANGGLAGNAGATKGRGFGGGVFNRNGAGTLNNVTLGGNTAKDGANANDQGGAIFNLADTALQTGSITLQNSIAAGSTASNDIQNTQTAGTATLTASAPNVVQAAIGNSAGTVNSSGVIVGDPALAALASNGGPTQTQAILSSSIAANAGNNALATSAGLTTDQRGFGRAAGAAVDLGAFEIQVPPTVSSVSPASGPPTGGTNVTITGSDFYSVSSVTIGGVAATAVVVVSPTSITCTTPAHASGVVNVVVTTAFGTGTGTGLFTYANLPPVITSPLNATPNPTVTGATVTFTVSATDPENDPLTTTFNYGDGSSGAGATHVYTSTGAFLAVATISDGTNAVTSSTTVTVTSADLNNDGQTTPMDVDTDGDGFPDDIEIAYGSSPTSAASTPTGAAAKPFIKFALTRVIVRRAPDRIDLRGILHVPAGLRLTGQKVVVDAGGNATAFTLNGSGSGTTGDSFLRIGTNAASFRDREARFTLKLKGTLLANLLLNAPHDAQGRATLLSVNILFNGVLLNSTANLKYRTNGVALFPNR